jgi:hypothetical protein
MFETGIFLDKISYYSPEYHKKYYQEHKVSIKDISKKKYLDNSEKYLERSKKQYNKVKLLVFNYYGKNFPKCVCCNENNIEFLAIHHIECNGNKHRKSINSRGGYSFYGWLIKNNFPEGYQILCHNCNMAKGFYGYCPHEKRDSLNA